MTDRRINYESIKEKYGEFTYPAATISIAGKNFSENGEHLVIADLTVDVSSGFEASAAAFSVYNVFDRGKKQYRFEQCRKYMLLGSDITISLGYGNQMTQIFQGFISQVRFVGTGEIIHHVEVMAMDVKGLMMSNSYARQVTADNYGDAVREIFKKPLYQKMYSDGIYHDIKVTDTPDKNSQNEQKTTSSSIEMVSESDYEFVVKAAKRFHYEFYVDAGVIYFRKAKETVQERPLKLGLEQGIKTYDISYDITGIVKSVEVRGMDTAKARLVSAVAGVSNKISTGNKAKALINKTKRVVIDANATSREQAQYRADSLMEDIAYRFGTLECECIGIPELKPGHFIEITGMGVPCDNKFYITNAKHVLTDTEGYYTQITAKAAALA